LSGDEGEIRKLEIIDVEDNFQVKSLSSFSQFFIFNIYTGKTD